MRICFDLFFQRKTIFLLCLFLFFSGKASLAANQTSVKYYNPVFPPTPKNLFIDRAPLAITDGTLSLELKPLPAPKQIRVLIFPHIGQYSVPQGRETILNQVTLSSVQQCASYDQASNAQLARASRFLLNAKSLSRPIVIRCPGVASIDRGPGLPSFVYQGDFFASLRKNSAGEAFVRIILELPFEEYLRGVVPAEMPATWHPEALKAQAIAARTYALYQIKNPTDNTDFDVDDTVLYQAYLGLSRVTAATDKSIADTAGLALGYNDQPISAFFSSDSGGYTESAEYVWGNLFPYTPSKPEIYDLGLINSNWSWVTTFAEISKQLAAAHVIDSGHLVNRILITQKSPSGRATRIELKFTDGQTKEVFGPDFQMGLRLKSNLLSILVNNTSDAVTIGGVGFGHGVGMNQSGANILATHYAFDFQKILNFYFSK